MVFIRFRLGFLKQVHPWLPQLVFTILMFGFFMCIPIMVCRKRMTKTIRSRINELGIPMCMECGYQLKGATGPRCPECGNLFGPLWIEGEPWDAEADKFFFGPGKSTLRGIRAMRFKRVILIYSAFFPDLRLIKDRGKERLAILNATRNIVWLQWVLAIVIPVVTIPLWQFGVNFIRPPLNEFVLLTLAVAMGAVWIFAPLLVYRKSIQRRVREEICSFGVPICITCGYQLRGIPKARCPECGSESTATPDEKLKR